MMFWPGSPSWVRWWANWHDAVDGKARVRNVIQSLDSQLIASFHQVEPAMRSTSQVVLGLSGWNLTERDSEIIIRHYRRKGWVVGVEVRGMIPPCLVFSFPVKEKRSQEVVPIHE